MSAAPGPGAVEALAAALEDCSLADRRRLGRRLAGLRRGGAPEALAALAAEVAEARERLARRRAALPAVSYPEELPISARRGEIAEAIARHPVVVVCGETGSGKSTQLPKICLELGRGVSGMIGHTQPRRLAARAVASRLAEELRTTVGGAVGYKVRFGDRVGPQTLVKVMTDGILLAETEGDRLLEHYDTLIIDEAHERSLNVDFLLGYLKTLLARRPELKVIVTSATIDPERFARHFDGAPVIEVSGRLYPVEVRYRPLGETRQGREARDQREERTDADLYDGVVGAAHELARAGRGDILVFLPGERDIRETAERLRKHPLPETDVLPLFARLGAAEQNRVFAPHGRRHLVLATNVAETSLTVPGVRFVIDTGLARIARYSPRSKVQRLPIEPVSRASADQRKGRCGRVAEGICIRLYSEEDYLAREAWTPPEVQRASLAGVILRLAALRFGSLEHFPFIDPPEPRFVADGYRLLEELGAIDRERRLTEVGRRLARLPLDPRIGRMLLAAREEGALAEVLVIAAALSVEDPRERPAEAREAADARHAAFADERSDFLWYVNFWRFFHEQARHLTQRKQRALCQEQFVSWRRLREWADVHAQLLGLLHDMGFHPNEIPADYEPVHRALLAGLLGNVACRAENQVFTGARGLKLAVFPGSALARKPPAWLMAAELVETRRTWARTVARIEPEWLERVGAHLLKRSHFEPHWSRRAGRVVGFERVSLFGLTLVAKRRIDYGPVDPAACREIFLREALARGEIDTRGGFLARNRARLAEVEALEHRLRRVDLGLDEDGLAAFYAERVPEGLCAAREFERWLRGAEARDPEALVLPRERLLGDRVPGDLDRLFPERWPLGGQHLVLRYRFEPGQEADGISVDVPLPLLTQLDPGAFEWLVPGRLREKVEALLRTLPKALRRHFVPVGDYAGRVLEALGPPRGRLVEALAEALSALGGVEVGVEDFEPQRLEPHLLMNFRVLDAAGRLLGQGRELGELQRELGERVRSVFARELPWKLARQGVTRWDFGDLPATTRVEARGLSLTGHPALVAEDKAVALRVVDNAELALHLTRAGLRRLYCLALPQQVAHLERGLPDVLRLCLLYRDLGGCEALKRELIEGAAGDAFLAEPGEVRSQAEFERRLARGRGSFVAAAEGRARLAGECLSVRREVLERLGAPALAAEAELQADARRQLDDLVYPGVFALCPLERLRQLPRYLKALRARLDKFPRDPARDRRARELLASLGVRSAAFTRYRPDVPPPAAALELYRWMLEELRVSLFAQELGTAMPVSRERLERQWEKVRPPAGPGAAPDVPRTPGARTLTGSGETSGK